MLIICTSNYIHRNLKKLIQIANTYVPKCLSQYYFYITTLETYMFNSYNSVNYGTFIWWNNAINKMFTESFLQSDIMLYTFFQVQNSGFTMVYIVWPHLYKNGLTKDYNEKYHSGYLWLPQLCAIIHSFLYHHRCA